MDNRDKKKWIKSLYIEEKFLFNYNGITDNNFNPNHNIEEF